MQCSAKYVITGKLVKPLTAICIVTITGCSSLFTDAAVPAEPKPDTSIIRVIAPVSESSSSGSDSSSDSSSSSASQPGTTSAAIFETANKDMQDLLFSDAFGRLGLASVRLGTEQPVALTEATDMFGPQLSCGSRKIALKDSRRAYLAEICLFAPDNASIAGIPVERIAYHFIDQWLVRIDIDAPAGKKRAVQTIKNTIDDRHGPAYILNTASDSAQVAQESYVWQLQDDEITLSPVIAPDTTDPITVRVRLLDKRAALRAQFLRDG